MLSYHFCFYLDACKAGCIYGNSLACLASDKARLVAIKDKVQYLAHLKSLRASNVDGFIEERKAACKSGVLDLAVV